MTEDNPIIVYVDDDRANRVVFEHNFKRDFIIKTAKSGPEALEILKDETVGVIVVDQRMPGMSGNELLERVKSMYPEIVRVIVTAYSELDPVLRAVNEGLVARYLIKPWDRKELFQILSWAMEAFKLGRNSSALQLRLLQTERLVTLGSIGAAVIHDISQPLSYLLSNTERLKQLHEHTGSLRKFLQQHGSALPPDDRQSLQDLVEEFPEIVQDMMEGCRVMKGLTDGIRRMLRPTNEKEDQRVDPVPVIRYAISVCRDIAVRARGQIMFDGPTTLPILRMGSTELSQILINLVANAAQALERKPQQHGKVVVGVREERDTMDIIIKDNGPGMPPEVLEKIGTPFFSTRPDGTGLGIAQCKRIIERDGGAIHIESTPDVGTTVTVTILKA